MAEKSEHVFLDEWKQLDDIGKDQLLRKVEDDPIFQPLPLRIKNKLSQAKKKVADSIQTKARDVYNNIQLRPHSSSLKYYPTIQWSLDKTPDTDDYWVGLYDKDEMDDKKYLAKQRIHKTAQGSYKVGKLKTTEFKLGSNRFEEYEARIFKRGYQRLHAQSNVLRGIVNYLPTNPFTPGTEKLLSGQKRRHSDKELESFPVGIRGDATTHNFGSPDDALKTWSGFTPNEKRSLFPHLEQDTLSDEIEMEDDKGTDPNLPTDDQNKLGYIDDYCEVPSHIVLTITLDRSSAYVYPEIDVEKEIPIEKAWLGVYNIHG